MVWPSAWPRRMGCAALIVAILLWVPPLTVAVAGIGPPPVKPRPLSSTDLTSMATDAYAYDAADHGELIFGNLGNPGYDQTWFQNPDAWLNETGAIGPSARFFATMAFDPLVGAVLLFGGESAVGGGTLNDT